MDAAIEAATIDGLLVVLRYTFAAFVRPDKGSSEAQDLQWCSYRALSMLIVAPVMRSIMIDSVWAYWTSQFLGAIAGNCWEWMCDVIYALVAVQRCYWASVTYLLRQIAKFLSQLENCCRVIGGFLNVSMPLIVIHPHCATGQSSVYTFYCCIKAWHTARDSSKV